MIVRVLGEGQFEVPDEALNELNELDAELVHAIEADDAGAFSRALEQLLASVRAGGSPLPRDHLAPSDYVLPGADSSLEEVRALLSEEGLLPG